MEQQKRELTPAQKKAFKLLLTKKYTLLWGGRRSGKSFIIIVLILMICNLYDKNKTIKGVNKPARVCILRYKFTDVRKYIINDTLPTAAKFLNIQYKLDQQQWVVYLGRWIGNKFIPNGSEIWFGGLDEGRGLDRVLGGEYLIEYLDEVSEISYSSIDTIKSSLAQNTGFKNKHLLNYHGIRELIGVKEGDKDDPFSGELGEMSNRIFYSENPPKKSHWSYKIFIEGISPEDRSVIKDKNLYGEQRLNPVDNPNLLDDYISTLEGLSEKKRKRFLLGEFDDDETSSLFTEGNINQHRLNVHPELRRIIIGVDPAVTNNERSDQTGIVVCGLGFDDRGYVLEDRTGNYTPSEWAEMVYDLFVKWDADLVVAEKNQGGDLVERNINVEYPNIPITTVFATKGKELRAEPVSNLYEKGKISHVGHFPDLEHEMCTFTGTKKEKSPNRLDSMVYAFAELMPTGYKSFSEVFRWDALKKYTELPEGIGYSVIRISDSDNYMYCMVNFIENENRLFLKSVIFNENMPIDNIPETISMISENKPELTIVEADYSFSSITNLIQENSDYEIRGVINPSDEENRILIESQFIKDNIIFPVNQEEPVRSFIRQLSSYTNLSKKPELHAASTLASMAYFYKLFK